MTAKGGPSVPTSCLFAFLPRCLELVAGFPLDGLRLFAGQPAEHEPKARQLGIPAEVPVGAVFVRGLVIVVGHVILVLRMSPSLVMPFEQLALVDGERGYAHAGEREVVAPEDP